MKKTWRYRAAIMVFVLPAILTFTVLVTYPVIQSFIKSFYKWDGLTPAKWLGMGNYIELFQDSKFYLANKNSLIFAIVLVAYQMGIGLLLALLLVTFKPKFSRFLRFSYFVPVVVSVTVICQLWITIYNYDYGLINQVLEMLNIDYRQSWLTDKNAAIFAVAFVNAWQYMGIQFIMIFTAICSIPEELYEAARIDGASNIKVHLKITVPMLRPTFQFCLIMAVTGGLKAFEQMFIMTSGGPGNYTQTLTYIMYKAAFTSNRFGYGSAVATVMVLECLLFTLLIKKITNNEKADM